MPRNLKIWNGSGWGRCKYGQNNERLSTPIEEWAERIYVCAHSKKEAAEIYNSVGKGHINPYYISIYWSEGCWGTAMKGIEPNEVGLWAQQHYDKPIRLYPEEK